MQNNQTSTAPDTAKHSGASDSILNTKSEKRKPDLSQTRRFLKRLAPQAEAFTFQTSGDSEQVKRERGFARTLHGAFDKLAPQLERLNARGAGVFVTINETDGKGRKKANIARVRAVFADFDGNAPSVEAAPIPPHIRIQSSRPGKEHWYWLVADMPLDRFTPIQAAIAQALGSDSSVKDLSRVMRLPGFYHMKDPKNPVLVEIVELDEERPPYSLDEIEKAFPPVVTRQRAGKGGGKKGKSENGEGLDPETLKWLKVQPAPPPEAVDGEEATDAEEDRKALDRACQIIEQTPEGERNNTLNAQAFRVFHLVKAKRLPPLRAYHRLREAALAAGLDKAEVRRTLKSAWESAKPELSAEQERLLEIDRKTAEKLAEELGVPVRLHHLEKPNYVQLDVAVRKEKAKLEGCLKKAEARLKALREERRKLAKDQGFDRKTWKAIRKLHRLDQRGGAATAEKLKAVGLGVKAFKQLTDTLADLKRQILEAKGVIHDLKAPVEPMEAWRELVKSHRGEIGMELALAEPQEKGRRPRRHPLDQLGNSDTWYGTRSGYMGIIEEVTIEKDGKVVGRVENVRPLTNFAARITREIVQTDGAEETRFFEVEGYLKDGETLPTITVPADTFDKMEWVPTLWGSRPVIHVGRQNRDHTSRCIRFLTGETLGKAPVVKRHAHTGWIKHNGKTAYLHAGGAITADGHTDAIELALDPPLNAFKLPKPPEGEALAEAVRQALALPGFAVPPRVGWPLLLYAVGAIFGPAPFTLFLSGLTGERKTSLALVFQSFFGWQGKGGSHPPAGWESTANYLETLTYRAKDCLLLIDDFVPADNRRNGDDHNRKAARLLRDQGNEVGRGRLRSDGSARPVRPPRGSLLVTGEDLPAGHSIRARCLVIPLAGDVDLDGLTQAQKLVAAGVYAQAMAGFIQWSAPRLREIKKRIEAKAIDLRARWRGHGRTNEALARLAAVAEIVMDFAKGCSAITDKDAAMYLDECMKAFDAIAQGQVEVQADQDPALLLYRMLYSMVTAGQAQLEPDGENVRDRLTDGQNFRAPLIGWVADDEILLEPDAAYNILKDWYAKQSIHLPTSRTFWRTCADKGIVVSSLEGSKRRFAVKRRVNGRRGRFVVIRIADMEAAISELSPAEGGHSDGDAF